MGIHVQGLPEAGCLPARPHETCPSPQGDKQEGHRALEEYLYLLIRTFDIAAEEAGMLSIVLHMNNLRPKYEKWPHSEQAKWWTHAERFDIMQQPLEFRRYITERYKVVAMLAPPAAHGSQLGLQPVQLRQSHDIMTGSFAPPK